jgi:hypothetical protein
MFNYGSVCHFPLAITSLLTQVEQLWKQHNVFFVPSIVHFYLTRSGMRKVEEEEEAWFEDSTSPDVCVGVVGCVMGGGGRFGSTLNTVGDGPSL